MRLHNGQLRSSQVLRHVEAREKAEKNKKAKRRKETAEFPWEASRTRATLHVMSNGQEWAKCRSKAYKCMWGPFLGFPRFHEKRNHELNLDFVSENASVND